MTNNPLDYDTESTSTVFRDIIFLALSGFVAIVLLILPHINPPAKMDDEEVPLPGNMMVEVFWNDKYDLDIDLWVQAPEDKAVGYSSKAGKMFNLLRDDLGYYNDISDQNYEIAVTRGLKAGEYTINVMFYANKHLSVSSIGIGQHNSARHSDARNSTANTTTKPMPKKVKGPPPKMPIEVKVIVSTKKESSKGMVRILEQTVELHYVKEEITVANFRLNADKDMIKSSLNNVYKGLASIDAPDSP